MNYSVNYSFGVKMDEDELVVMQNFHVREAKEILNITLVGVENVNYMPNLVDFNVIALIIDLDSDYDL